MNRLLGPADVRELAAALSVSPTKALGQNFVIDANTVRMIVSRSGVGPADDVLEVGPGLGSLTLALLDVAASVTAVEIDPNLADALPATVARFAPDALNRLRVVTADALTLTDLTDPQPTQLVANLPYNVAVPVLLTALASFPSLNGAMVMVQKEVADRLCATPGSKLYGVPSVKVAWYADVVAAGRVSPSVFWPTPRVDSGLVRLSRHAEPQLPGVTAGEFRATAFAAIDAAFGQRRKVLRTALAGWAGGVDSAVGMLEAAGIDPGARGETLTAADFARLSGEKLRGPTP